MVPFGPKLLFRISCKPLAADMFMAREWEARAISAFGFRMDMADIFSLKFFKLFYLKIRKIEFL